MYRDMEEDRSFIGKERHFITKLTNAFLPKTGWTKSPFPLKMPYPGTREWRFPEPPYMEAMLQLQRRLRTKEDPDSEMIQKLIDADKIHIFERRSSAPHELTIQIDYLMMKAMEADIETPPINIEKGCNIWDTPFFNWKIAINYGGTLWRDMAKLCPPRRVIKI